MHMLVARLRKKLEHTLKSVFTDGVRYLENVFNEISMLCYTGHCISAQARILYETFHRTHL